VSDITAGVGGNPISLQNAHYTFDALGNLTQRSESVLNPATQSFAYDQVDRLTSYAGQSAAYDAAGNLTSRAGTSYSYQAGTHRMSGYGSTGYGYDANGNVTSISGGTTRTITPTAFNLPNTIVQGTTSLSYIYDGGHKRIKETSTTAGGTTTTYYLGGYEELTRTDGITERRHYLATPDGTAGIVIRRSDGTTAPRYWLTDHLGSVVAEVDQSGALKQSATFGAWGDRTQVVQADPRAEDRGFTGHEHLVEVGLIHMNGRVYDPLTGRFLAADPLIQDPYDAQSYNRYSYVRNNPLSFTDPSGYSWWTKYRKPIIAIAAAVIISPLVAAEVMWALAPTSANAAAIGELAGAVAGGFAAGGIQGGNVQSAVAGAMSASIFFAAGSIAGAAAADQIVGFGRGGIGRVALHAGAGCFTGAAMGGSCGKQAVAGGFSELAGPIVDRASTNVAFGVVAHAVAGGLGSMVAGGRFENGAITGAFGYLFNQVAHPGDDEFANGTPGQQQLSAMHEAGVRAAENGTVVIEELGWLGIGSIGGRVLGGLTRFFGVGSRVAISEGRLGHIFRDAEGHLLDTPANRALLVDVANNRAARLGKDRFGNIWNAATREDGTQAWVQIRNGQIVNGGVNSTPRTFNPHTGLSSLEKP